MDASAELEHRRLDQLQHQASALSTACDELLSDTSQRSQELQALSQVRRWPIGGARSGVQANTTHRSGSSASAAGLTHTNDCVRTALKPP